MVQKHRGWKHARWPRIAMLLLLVALIGIALSITGYILFMIEETLVVPYRFKVENRVAGLDAGTDSLTFGTLPPEGHAVRSVTIATEKDVRVMITISGKGAAWMTVSENDFFLPAGGNKTVDFTVTVPVGAQVGPYEGVVRAMLYRANPGADPDANPEAAELESTSEVEDMDAQEDYREEGAA